VILGYLEGFGDALTSDPIRDDLEDARGWRRAERLFNAGLLIDRPKELDARPARPVP